MKNESNAVPTWDEMADLFMEREYDPADDTDCLCVYLDIPTGLKQAPEYVSVIAKFYDGGYFIVEVAAASYERATRKDSSSIGDMFYTFISNEAEHVSIGTASVMLTRAEEAAKLYVESLNRIKQV